MQYQLGSLFALALLLAAIVLAGAAGDRWLFRARADNGGIRARDGKVDLLLLHFGIGVGLWILALFALASLGALRTPAIAALVGVSIAAGAIARWTAKSRRVPGRDGAPSVTGRLAREQLPRDRASSDETSRREPLPDEPSAGTSRWRRLAALLLGGSLLITLAGLLIQTLRPDLSWDANVYHLTLPRLFLEHGGFYRVPFNVYSNWPLGIELLFAAAMAVRGYVVAKLVHFAFGVFTLVAIARVAGARVGLLGAAFFLFNPVVLYEIRIAYIDLAYAFLFLLAAARLCRALDGEIGGPERSRDLLLAGWLGGILCAVKLNGFFGPLVLIALWAIESIRSRVGGPEGRRLGRELALLVGACLLFGLPWLLKSLALTGNPFYPIFYDHFGGPEWSAALSEQHAAWQRAIGMGRSVLDFLLLPFRVILLGDHGYASFDGEIHPAWLLLLPIGLYGARRSAIARRFLVVSGLYFALWSVTSQQMRLLIPILPLLSVAAALGVRRILERLDSSRRNPGPALSTPVGPILQASLAVLVSLALVASAWTYLRQTPRLTRDLIVGGERLRDAVVHPVYRFVSNALPEDARLLLINTNHSYFLERDFVADSFFEASQIVDAFADASTESEVLDRFRELALSHVLVENRAGPAYPDALVRVLQEPTLAIPIYRSEDERYVVLELVGVR